MDLAMVAAQSGNEVYDKDVYVLLGAGNGTFAKPVAYGVEGSPFCVVIGDVNRDGVLDLVTGIYESSGTAISVLLGVGKGAFARSVAYAAENLATVAIGDLDGDGFMDLAYVGDGFSDVPSLVYVLYGVGNGKFANPVSYSTGGNSPVSVAVGDLNGDGIADVATSDFGDNGVVVMLGERNRTLSRAGKYAVGSSEQPLVVGVAIGDLNGDGVLDIVTANNFDSSASVLMGVGNGTFRRAVSYPTISQPSDDGPESVAVGDLNGDGLLDIVVTSASPDSVVVLVGVGKGVFSAPHSYGFRDFPIDVGIGDLNGDGVMDLVVLYYDGWSILFGHRAALVG
jgi:Tfp pilus tip-associated adhesin PilY1